AIQDRNRSFARQLFAVSAVSGGALGGAAFAVLGSDPPNCRMDGQESHSFRDCLSAFLSYDFLSPIMASALTGDLLQTSTGIPIFIDRSVALERSWEKAWERTFVGTNWLERPFDDRWRTDGSFHVNVFLNGTIADSGQPLRSDRFPNLRAGERAVTGNLQLMQHTGASEILIENPAARRRISLSTAIDNSPRFPFVEPIGAVPPLHGQDKSDVPPTYFVADGGYYDNYGAATLLDLLYMIANRPESLTIDR